MIHEDDQNFLHYFIIGLLEYYTEDIICCDLSNIPSLISSINLKSYEMINEIFDNAIKLRAITPYSFRLIFDEMEIFKQKCIRHKENYDKFKPESILCLPILPCEIFCITYTNIVKCPDNRCLNFIDLKELDIDGDEENLEMELNIKIDNRNRNRDRDNDPDNKSSLYSNKSDLILKKSNSNLASDVDTKTKKKWVYQIDQNSDSDYYNDNYNNSRNNNRHNENSNSVSLGNNFETFGNSGNKNRNHEFYNRNSNSNDVNNYEEEYESVRGYSKKFILLRNLIELNLFFNLLLRSN